MFLPQRFFPGLFLSFIAGICYAAPPPAIILNDPSLPSNDIAEVKILSTALKGAGYAPSSITVDGLLRPGSLDQCRMLVLPGCRALPIELVGPVTDYLKRGGGLFALVVRPRSHELIRSG